MYDDTIRDSTVRDFNVARTVRGIAPVKNPTAHFARDRDREGEISGCASQGAGS